MGEELAKNVTIESVQHKICSLKNVDNFCKFAFNFRNLVFLIDLSNHLLNGIIPL
jgi:hypothetical protein